MPNAATEQARRFFSSGLYVIASLAIATAAVAQSAALKIVRPPLVDQYPTFDLNDEISLPIDPAAASKFPTNFEVYAIWAKDHKQPPDPINETRNCAIYEAARLSRSGRCYSTLCLGSVDVQWKNLVTGTTNGEETYLLVFEIGKFQPLDIVGPTSGIEHLAIRKVDKKNFFSGAVRVTVHLDRSSPNPGILSGISSFFSFGGTQSTPPTNAVPGLDPDKVTCIQIVKGIEAGPDAAGVAYLRPCDRSAS